MSHLLLIAVCLFAGVLLARLKVFPKDGAAALNQFVLSVSLPALVLFYIPKINFSSDVLMPVAVAWGSFFLAAEFFFLLGKIWHWPKSLTGCLMLTGGLGNTSFVGFPLIEALYGKQGLETAILVDQPGTFMVMSTAGIVVATIYSGKKADARDISKRVMAFPPFQAFVLSVVLAVFGLHLPAALDEVADMLGRTISPVALVAIGLQLQWKMRRMHVKALAIGLGFKLFLLPAFFLLVLRVVMGNHSLGADVSIIEAAMAPMITASVIASSYRLKPKLASLMVGTGIPLSLVTVMFWHWILSMM